MYNTKSSVQTIQATKGDSKGLNKWGKQISINEDHNYITSTLHKDTNTLSPLNNNAAAGVVYSPNCENFQKRKIA